MVSVTMRLCAVLMLFLSVFSSVVIASPSRQAAWLFFADPTRHKNGVLSHGQLSIRQSMPISSDGSCGSINGVNTTCQGSVEGNCCSLMSFCGNNASYCGAGCQPAFGVCGDPNISTDGSCGGGSGYTCLGSTLGNCCSRIGYCGSNASYCATGCQSGFGECWNSPKSSAGSTSSTRLPSATLSNLPSQTPSSAAAKSSSDNTGLKAGVGVAVAVVVLALIGLAALLLLRRRRRSANNARNAHELHDETKDGTMEKRSPQEIGGYEHAEMEAADRKELHSEPVPVELPAIEVKMDSSRHRT